MASLLSPQRLIDWLWPDSCASCGDAPLPRSEGLFCASCRGHVHLGGLRRQLRSLTAFACSSYEGPVGCALRRFKFDGHPELARRLAATLHPHVSHALRSEHVLVPVPLHPLRLAERGYNQSALLARRCAKLGGHRCLPRALVRTAPTRRQTELSRQERWLNVQGKFAARHRLDATTVVLVDDVLTTGATLEACAAALRAAGAGVASAITFAQAP